MARNQQGLRDAGVRGIVGELRAEVVALAERRAAVDADLLAREAAVLALLRVGDANRAAVADPPRDAAAGESSPTRATS